MFSLSIFCSLLFLPPSAFPAATVRPSVRRTISHLSSLSSSGLCSPPLLSAAEVLLALSPYLTHKDPVGRPSDPPLPPANPPGWIGSGSVWSKQLIGDWRSLAGSSMPADDLKGSIFLVDTALRVLWKMSPAPPFKFILLSIALWIPRYCRLWSYLKTLEASLRVSSSVCPHGFCCVSVLKLQPCSICQLRCGDEEETHIMSAALSCLSHSLFLSLIHLHRISTMILVTHKSPESFYIIISRRVIKKDLPVGTETPSPPLYPIRLTV